jgi:hypothetical protein
MDDVYKNDPCFWEYFVLGAPCSLNMTLNKELGLVNAVKGTQFSLVMNSEDEQSDVDAALHLHPPGSVIDIPCPLAINVAFGRNEFTIDQLHTLNQYYLFNGEACSFPLYVSEGSCNPLPRGRSNGVSVAKKRRKSNERKRSDDVIVPILRGLSKVRDKVHGYGTRNCDPFLVVNQQRFPIDSGFAITVNRSQGQTLDHVILAISRRDVFGCNFRYNGIYVAFSRVRDRKNIRLLLIGDTIPQKWNSVLYIPNLKPDLMCHLVLCGWQNHGGNRWQTDEWSCVLARRAYETDKPNKRSRRSII